MSELLNLLNYNLENLQMAQLFWSDQDRDCVGLQPLHAVVDEPAPLAEGSRWTFLADGSTSGTALAVEM